MQKYCLVLFSTLKTDTNQAQAREASPQPQTAFHSWSRDPLSSWWWDLVGPHNLPTRPTKDQPQAASRRSRDHNKAGREGKAGSEQVVRRVPWAESSPVLAGAYLPPPPSLTPMTGSSEKPGRQAPGPSAKCENSCGNICGAMGAVSPGRI